jgi:hypothetical protein
MDGAPAYRRVEADDDEAVQLYNVVVSLTGRAGR